MQPLLACTPAFTLAIDAGQMTMSVRQDQEGIINKTYELLKQYQAGEEMEKNQDFFIPGVALDASNLD